MHVYVCICRYIISICMYCMYWNTGAQKPPQRTQNILSWPSTRGNPLRAPQGMCLNTFRPHPSPPPPPDFFIFSWRNSGWSCLATALESAWMLRTCQNFAQLPSHDHFTVGVFAWSEIRYLFMAWGCIKDALHKQFCVLDHLTTAVESSKDVSDPAQMMPNGSLAEIY
jgi:hypothetical protein